MATRFYFPLTTPPDGAITPSLAAWNYTTEVLRRKMVTAKPTGDAITQGSQIGPWTATAGQTAVDRQYISAPLAAGQTISGTVAAQVMVREFATTDNVDRGLLAIKVVSADGATLRATLLALGNYGPTLEFISNATCRNKTFADGDAITTYTPTIEGDRIVVEIGYQNSTAGTTPEAAAKYGGNATDLPVNETQTTNGAPWIEFSANLTFQSLTGTGAVTAGAATGAGAGALDFYGQGVGQASAALGSGVAVERFVGTGGSAAQIATGAGAGSVSGGGITGSGAGTATVALAAGLGVLAFYGDGNALSSVAGGSGFGTLSFLAAGGATASPAIGGGTAVVDIEGAGSAVAGAAIGAGVGAVTNAGPTAPIGGGFIRKTDTGRFEREFRQMMAARAVRGTADLVAQPAMATGRGTVRAVAQRKVFSGHSGVTASRATSTALGRVEFYGDGAVMAPLPLVAGRGVVYLTKDQDDAEVFMLLSLLQK